ncbi:SDR family oxidoreductase [Zavarzinia compransoris]|uniref:SDR family NAD(P)-dependent oxidoreductase n=1 Tax=Zavarzinia marina TaxID=2911065 RepID=UPI001F40B7F7|nr:SDR family oxidoreductase [Zavarzinia marina]MCF4166276.1 SDR family oxidoreductase [Zavarzinia marina]
MAGAFEGMKILVTGAASGIGKAIAEGFATQGARVAGLDLRAGQGAGFAIIGSDVGHGESARAGVAEAAKALGGIDVLVNCAGIEISRPLADVTEAEMDRMMAVNVKGPVLVTQAALPFLAPDARIVNIASELAYLGRAGSSVYAATKGAILSLTRSWARELGPAIRVNAVAPGPVDTPLLDFAHMDPGLKAIETGNPLGRIGQPGEVAAAVLFLAGPGAGFITGQCIGVDGGAAMR